MKIVKFFDKVEDKVRGRLSRLPILYAFIGSVGVVLVWRGIWHTADLVAPLALGPSSQWYPREPILFFDGPITLLIGCTLLLMTGLFVSSFIGNEIIISGLKGEKKIAEKTKSEVQNEESELLQVKHVIKVEESELMQIRSELAEIRRELQKISKPHTSHRKS